MKNEPGETVYVLAMAFYKLKEDDPGTFLRRTEVKYDIVRKRNFLAAAEGTFNPNGALHWKTRQEAESFRKTLQGPERFTVVEHVRFKPTLEKKSKSSK